MASTNYQLRFFSTKGHMNDGRHIGAVYWNEKLKVYCVKTKGATGTNFYISFTDTYMSDKDKSHAKTCNSFIREALKEYNNIDELDVSFDSQGCIMGLSYSGLGSDSIPYGKIDRNPTRPRGLTNPKEYESLVNFGKY